MKVLQKILLIFLIYIIVILSWLFVFNHKLSSDEYESISGIYNEMHLRQKEIKNDFYINYLLKILDRKIIIDELKEDSLYYTVNQSINALDMILHGYNADYILRYFDRTYIDFNKYVGMEYVTEIQNLNSSFYNNYDESEENLEVYMEYFDMIVSKAETEVNGIKLMQFLWISCLFVSFIAVNIICNFKEIHKYSKIKEKERSRS